MDKRLFLALALTTIVVVLSQALFGPKPGQQTAAQRDSIRAESARVAATTRNATSTQNAAANAPAGTVGSNTTTSPATVAAAPRADSLGAAPAPAAPETTVVEAPLAVYRFTSLGAAPLGSELRSYTSRRPGEKGKPVTLGHVGEPLLRYRLVGPGDTLDLSRVHFTRTTPAGANPVRFTAAVNGATISIGYAVVPDSYVVHVSGQVENAPADRFLLVDLPSGFQSTEVDTADDAHHLAYAYKPEKQDAKSVAFSKLDPGERFLESRPLTWVVAKSKYFLVGLIADARGRPFDELSVTGAPRTSKVVTTGQATAVQRLDGGRFGFSMYAGPQEWRRLRALGNDFETANPYGGFLQGIVQPFATIVMRVLLWMHDSLKLSYGWVLVIFGVVIRLALWPLNQKAMRTSLKMQRVQPELQEIQKRYRDDPAKLQTEMMRIYREHGMSPFSAFGGCLPALIPMPVLFALFYVFGNTIEFRGVPFLWLPDISVKDPYYILPILMGVTMFITSWIGLKGAPPNPQSQMMAYIFPPMMTVIFLRFASGLNLYYTVQNLMTIPQQWMLSKERLKANLASGTPPVQGAPAVKQKPAPATRR